MHALSSCASILTLMPLCSNSKSSAPGHIFLIWSLTMYSVGLLSNGNEFHQKEKKKKKKKQAVKELAVRWSPVAQNYCLLKKKNGIHRFEGCQLLREVQWLILSRVLSPELLWKPNCLIRRARVHHAPKSALHFCLLLTHNQYPAFSPEGILSPPHSSPSKKKRVTIIKLYF